MTACIGCGRPAAHGLNGLCVGCWRWLDACHRESAERALEREMALVERDRLGDRRDEAS